MRCSVAFGITLRLLVINILSPSPANNTTTYYQWCVITCGTFAVVHRRPCLQHLPVATLKWHSSAELHIYFLVHLESIYYQIFFYSKTVLIAVLQNNYLSPKCIGDWSDLGISGFSPQYIFGGVTNTILNVVTNCCTVQNPLENEKNSSPANYDTY